MFTATLAALTVHAKFEARRIVQQNRKENSDEEYSNRDFNGRASVPEPCAISGRALQPSGILVCRHLNFVITDIVSVRRDGHFDTAASLDSSDPSRTRAHRDEIVVRSSSQRYMIALRLGNFPSSLA